MDPQLSNAVSRMKKFLTYIWEYFLRAGKYRFYTLLIPKVTSFVALRSTKVDHIFGSCRGRSQLFPAIFIAPRNLLVAQKDIK